MYCAHETSNVDTGPGNSPRFDVLNPFEKVEKHLGPSRNMRVDK